MLPARDLARPGRRARLGTAAALVLVVGLGAALVAAPVTAPHAAAAGAHGNLLAWGDRDSANDLDVPDGDNAWGQLNLPSALATRTITAVSAGPRNSMALDSEGKVHVWGDPGLSGWETATPSSLTGKVVTRISAGTGFMLALTSTGEVVAWGINNHGQTAVPQALAGQRVVDISAGFSHALALTDTGKVYAWGDASSGATTVPATALSGVVGIDAGWHASVAVRANHDVAFWGDSQGGLMSPPASLAGKTITSVQLGESQAVALDTQGLVHGWGWNSFGAATPPPALSARRVIAIDSGGRQSAAVTDDGKTFVWGYDGYSAPADTDNQSVVPAHVASSWLTGIAVSPTHLLGVVRPDIEAGAAPTIAGTPMVGELLTVTGDTTVPAMTLRNYQWLSDEDPIVGATVASYRPTAAEAGHRLQVRVVSSLPGWTSLTRTTAPTTAVAAAPVPSAPVPPVVAAVTSRTTLRATAPGRRRVRLQVTVNAPGVPVTAVDGQAVVLRGTRTLRPVTVTDGRAVVVLTGQPRRRQTYRVQFLGSPGVAAPSGSGGVRVRVR